jgi:uncharacterized protein (DUF924 family)
MSINPQDVLDFWFDPSTEALWYARDSMFDARIREHFGDALDAATRGHLDDWAASPQGWLALLIVLDQFSRNIYRDDARAWVMDHKAQGLALAGISRGDDRRLPPLQRLFAYMPLEHAEDLSLQCRCVDLFEQLVSQVSAPKRGRFEDFLAYARRHHELIERFGRFPHRNALLGRASTSAEQDYLARPGSGF